MARPRHGITGSRTDSGHRSIFTPRGTTSVVGVASGAETETTTAILVHDVYGTSAGRGSRHNNRQSRTIQISNLTELGSKQNLNGASIVAEAASRNNHRIPSSDGPRARGYVRNGTIRIIAGIWKIGETRRQNARVGEFRTHHNVDGYASRWRENKTHAEWSQNLYLLRGHENHLRRRDLSE